MKKAALISPKGNAFGKNEKMQNFLNNSKFMESFKVLWSGPNLGLLTIAALFPAEWEFDYIDGNYREIDFETSYDLVCVSAMTQQITNAYVIADRFREKGVYTVVGGIHATILPQEAALHADTVIIGEGEPLFKSFLSDLSRNCAKKTYREEGAGDFELKDSPVPRFDLLKSYSYPLVTLQTTRGCPHDCSFCAASKVFGRKYRRKSNDQILGELTILNALYPGRLILFADDNLFVNRSESKALLIAMSKMNLRFIAQTDVSIANDSEFLELMVKAGCQWVVIGFESPSYESLQGLDNGNWKLKQMPKYANSIEEIQSFGIGVYGTFIIGLDNDHTDQFRKTAHFILENDLYGANITVPTPLPGTRLRAELDKEHRILTSDWQYYTFWDVTVQPKNMTVAELEDGLLSIYKMLSESDAVQKRLLLLRRMTKIRHKILSVQNRAD
jgi:radical SAM superfamily enzyme YgiQ (UPF0313 family)